MSARACRVGLVFGFCTPSVVLYGYPGPGRLSAAKGLGSLCPSHPPPAVVGFFCLLLDFETVLATPPLALRPRQRLSLWLPAPRRPFRLPILSTFGCATIARAYAALPFIRSVFWGAQ